MCDVADGYAESRRAKLVQKFHSVCEQEWSKVLGKAEFVVDVLKKKPKTSETLSGDSICYQTYC